RILITGTNSRQKGNVTLWDIDLATLFNIQHLFGFRSGSFNINGTEFAIPDTPYPALTPALTTGTYDWRIVVDLPVYPFDAPPATKAQFLVRNEEWKDAIQLQFTFGTQQGNATGALGVAGATTTVTFSSFGSGAGAPTLDVYSLPVVMGLDLKDQFLPGF